MEDNPMKRVALSVVVAVVVLIGVVARGAPTYPSLTDVAMVSDSTTRTIINTVSPGLSDPYVSRSRASTGQDSMQVATFLRYDLSGLTPAHASDPAFAATFRIDYTQRLNTSNSLAVLLGRNDSGAWDSAGSNYPLHDWGFDDETSTLNAEDTAIVVNNVRTQVPTDDIEIDVTGIVADWVNGVHDNQGFVLCYDKNEFQGAAFDNPELIVEVPEPSTLGLLLTAVCILAGGGRRSCHWCRSFAGKSR